jgi:hypothetical protein
MLAIRHTLKIQKPIEASMKYYMQPKEWEYVIIIFSHSTLIISNKFTLKATKKFSRKKVKILVCVQVLIQVFALN